MSSTVRKGTIGKKLFVAGYLAGITVATITWVSAFGWVAVRVVKWAVLADQS